MIHPSTSFVDSLSGKWNGKNPCGTAIAKTLSKISNTFGNVNGASTHSGPRQMHSEQPFAITQIGIRRLPKLF